ncbi:MAG: hypothetical protein AAF581_00860 [Planctomycetota bacterium]
MLALTRTTLCWVFALAALSFAGPVAAQNVDYSVDAIDTYPGALELLPFRISTDAQLNAFDVAVTYGAGLEVTDVNTLGSVIANTTPETFLIDLGQPGVATASVVLDSIAPFDSFVQVGIDSRVLNFVVEVDAALPLGAQLPVTLTNGVGVPAISNVAAAAGVAVTPASLTDGLVTIASLNTIMFADTTAAPGDQGHLVDLLVDNAADMDGFSAVGTFDAAFVQLQDFIVTNTITDMVGAEYVESIVDNTAGEFIIGVILDLMPPFDQQTIPSTGQPLAVGSFVFDILPAAAAVPEVDLAFVNNIGLPPVQNVFVFDQRAIFPEQQDGVIEMLAPPVFLRGDANNDGVVDISDGVVIALFAASMWTADVCLVALDTNDNSLVDLADAVYALMFLFQAGPVIPVPYPVPGIDPTDPFALPCDL